MGWARTMPMVNDWIPFECLPFPHGSGALFFLGLQGFCIEIDFHFAVPPLFLLPAAWWFFRAHLQ